MSFEYVIRPANDRDYGAFSEISHNVANFSETFIQNSGYNPGSREGNRQVCKICGKGGPECIGHPLVLNMESLGRRFVSEFCIKHITQLSNIICRGCKKIVRPSSVEKFGEHPTISELASLAESQMRCDCASPKIIEFKEQQKEKRQKYQKRDTKPKNFTTSADDLYEIIADENFKFPSYMGINKELILGFFYNKIFLLPSVEHQINFVPGLETSVNEVTGMMKLYEMIYNSVTKYGDPDSLELKNKLTCLQIGEKDNAHTGTPSYLTMMNGKEGLFRNEGINKRSFNTARAVISLGVLRSGQVQIPSYIKSNLQYRIKVASYNIQRLQSKVGVSVTHLVSEMETSSLNKRKNFIKLTTNDKLKIGDCVLKLPENGDYVIFSRQPTLWRHSELGYIAVEWDNKCIGLPETNTAGHNADFDGDEGNISIGANLESRIETEMSLAKYNLTGAHSGEPVIGITYNGTVGAYVISTDDNIPEHLFKRLVSIIEGEDIGSPNSPERYCVNDIKVDVEYYKKKAEEHKINYHSGRILISMLLPKNLEYRRGDVVIKKGIMVAGKLKKIDVANKLITAITNVSPWRRDYLFVDRGYAMLSEYITAKGITISSEDYIMPGELSKQVRADNMKELLKKLERDVKKLEEMKVGQTKAYVVEIEEQIIKIIGDFERKATSIMEESDYRNRDIAKVSFGSGARGNISNVMSAAVMVFQLYEGSDRLGENGETLSPYQDPDDVSLYSRGFVANSYSNGLSVDEMFMVANPSRRSAFTVYSGTPESGNASRQTVRNLGGLHVDATLALVDRTGRTVDPLYGCGCDPARIQNQEVNGFTYNSPLNVRHTIEILRNKKKF